METEQWIDQAIELKKKYSWTQLPIELEKIFGEPFHREQVRSAIRQRCGKFRKGHKAREGQEERKPRITESNGGYIIYSNRREVWISKEKLTRLKELYCGDTPLTINQVCYKLDIPRRDFHLIKTAFDITHDDVPFINEELENQPIGELVKRTLEKRKEAYFLKLQQEEINQLKREVLKYRQKDYWIGKIDEVVKEHMQDFNKNYTGPVIHVGGKSKRSLLLEIPIVDLHLGKLAYAPETGENYDYKIAQKRFMFVVEDIYNKAKERPIDKILFVVGSDFFHFDGKTVTTTDGTPQDADLRWQKLFAIGNEMLIRAIDLLATKAPVEVLGIPGNHDHTTAFYAIKYLQAWYKNDATVDVSKNIMTRKYIEFGKNLIGFSHGDKEKNRIYGAMSIEAPEAWGRTKYREFHIGHEHHEQTNEHSGIKLRRLSSLSGTDAWHFEKAFIGSIKSTQSFVWDKEKGLQEILFANILS